MNHTVISFFIWASQFTDRVGVNGFHPHVNQTCWKPGPSCASSVTFGPPVCDHPFTPHLLPCSVFSALFPHPPPKHPVDGVGFSCHFPPVKNFCWSGTSWDFLLEKQQSEMWQSASCSWNDGSGRDQRWLTTPGSSPGWTSNSLKFPQNPDTKQHN